MRVTSITESGWRCTASAGRYSGRSVHSLLVLAMEAKTLHTHSIERKRSLVPEHQMAKKTSMRSLEPMLQSGSLRLEPVSSRGSVFGSAAFDPPRGTIAVPKNGPAKHGSEALPESPVRTSYSASVTVPVDEIVSKVTRELDRRLAEQRKMLEDQLAAQRLLLEQRIVAQEKEVATLRDTNMRQTELMKGLETNVGGGGALPKRKRPPTDKEYMDELFVEDLYAYRRVKPWSGLSRVPLYLFYFLYGPVGCCLVVVRLVLLVASLAVLHILPKQCRAAFCIGFVYPIIIPLCGVWATSTNSRYLEKVSGPKVVVINHTSNFDP